MAVEITYLGTVPISDTIECHDGECDACPGWWDSILIPGRIYRCGCSCHD